LQNHWIRFRYFRSEDKSHRTATNNTITDNVIIAHYAGISLLGVGNTEVANNEVTLTHLGGRAIDVQWNSDRNNLHDNTIIGDFDSLRSGAYEAPATDASGHLLNLASNPLRDLQSNPQLVFIGDMQGSERPLLTAVVDGAICQFRIDPSPADSDFTENNVFEGNTIKLNKSSVYDASCLLFQEVPWLRTIPSLLTRNRRFEYSRNWVVNCSFRALATPIMPKSPGAVSIRRNVILRPQSAHAWALISARQ
jgi:parallel beta-helix repeat protein